MVKKFKYLKKLSSFLQKGVLTSLLLSLVPFLVVILLKPIDFQEYLLLFNGIEARNGAAIKCYEDLDGDNKEEFIFVNNHQDLNLAIQIYDSYGTHKGQFNMLHFMPKTTEFVKPIFIDINKDGIKEIILFSQNKDSLLLNIFDYKKLKFILTDKFIAKIGFKDKLDYQIRYIESKDINNDDVEELYFLIRTGFGLYPRNIYRYDFVSDSLISSPNSGALMATYHFNKIKNNSTDNQASTLFVGTHAAGNCPPDYPYPYSDSCSWIFGFNEILEYKFKPIPFIGNISSISSIVETSEGIAAIFRNHGKTGDSTQLVYINAKGEITNRKSIESSSLRSLYIKKNLHYIFKEYDGRVSFFNIKDGNIGKEIKELQNCAFKSSKDIDFDGELEHLFHNGRFQQLVVARNDLSSIQKTHLYLKKEIVLDISSGLKKGVVEILVHTNFNIYSFKYYKNLNYQYKYLFWLVIYLLSYIFINLILFIQKKSIQKKARLEKRIIQLQLRNAQNHLDPHFTFNALNSVANYIFKEDKYKAYDLFERFSRLMRSSLAFSDKIFRNLEDELQFTEDYLEFQKSRFKERFEYKISVADDIDKTNLQLPKMIIQGFAENTIKHAFSNINYKGLIQIKIEKKDNHIQINIEDNGIGINASKKENPIPKSGYGIHILEEQIALINNLYEKKIKLEIIDKSLQGENLSGTTVLLKVNVIDSK